MKVLLINPPIHNMVISGVSNFEDRLLDGSPIPPLGLMYLAAYVDREGCKPKILDMVAEHSSIDNLREEVTAYKPDIVGITTTTLTLYDTLQVAKAVKNIGTIPIVVGGAHCNIYPEETLALGYFDYVVQGDGEFPFAKILNGKQDTAICSIAPVLDLDSLPFPARYLTDVGKYYSVISKSTSMTTMITSRGCPYNCTFCYQPHYKKWRARSAESVVAEMEEIVKMGIHEIEIYDDTFTYDRERVMAMCWLIIDKGLKVDWAIRTRVDKVDYPLLMRMREAGCKRINYGVESVTPSILKVLRKGFTVQQTIDALRWTEEAGIETQSYFMIGSPTETREQILDTMRFANKHIAGYTYYTITTPLPGTYLYSLGIKEGRFNDYWKSFAINPIPKFVTKIWDEDNRDEMRDLIDYGYRSFYTRPKYVLRQLINVRSIKELIRKAKAAIKMFT